jgi:hypothetical protein
MIRHPGISTMPLQPATRAMEPGIQVLCFHGGFQVSV